MTERVVVDTKRGPVEWSFERPEGFKVLPRAVPTLGYPWEVAGAGDWDFPPSCPTTKTEEELYGGLPRLDLMPSGSVFVWLLMGDLRLDYEVLPPSDSPLVPDQYVAPLGVDADDRVDAFVAPFTDGDQVEGKFSTVSSWYRLVFLSNASGEVEATPLYLMLQAFAGPQRASISTLDSLVSSLSYRYVGYA